MEPEQIKDFYSSGDVVQHYAHATTSIGLWASEEKIFTRVFRKEDTLLDLGTGTGRIALGLYEIGYKNVLGLDLSREMIVEARRLARILDYAAPFCVGNALELGFGSSVYDGVIFGFNGLMQIPQRQNRRRALDEIFATLRPGGYFVFTTHDRESQYHKDYWEEEKARWRESRQNPRLDELGDRLEPSPLGEIFIHVPLSGEIREDLESTGFRVEVDVFRSHVANESEAVREFSDDCRFWVAQKPA